MKNINIKNILSHVPQIAGIIALISLVAQYGFYLNSDSLAFFRNIDQIIATVFVASFLLNLVTNNIVKVIQKNKLETALVFIFLLSLILERMIQWQFVLLTDDFVYIYIKIYYIIIQIYILFNALVTLARTRDRWLFVSISPSKVLVFSFFFIIVLGIFLLKMPRATYNGIAWIDAIFLSTSAVCVTGLTPLNIVSTFTPVGQVIIMLLFQVGGLGIVTLTSFIALIFQQKGRFRLQDQVIMMEVLDDKNLSRMGEMLRSIIRITLTFEFIGAIVLWMRWKQMGAIPDNYLFKAIFHSISAYCNAGFSNITNGLQTSGLNSDPTTMITVMLLIVGGGLGFYTLRDLFFSRRYSEDHSYHLTLQTKMILTISGSLIILGTVAVLAIQWSDWSAMPAGLKILNGFFTSITSRTAGFSTVDIASLKIPALLIIILLMYIGAAPNSTGGGIKVTTVGSLLAASWAFILGKERVEIGWNTIPINTIRRSLIVLLGSLILNFFAVFIVCSTETAAFEDCLFEVISAFGTVGLSRGLTPYLGDLSKITLTIVMFMGRVGLFTLAIAVGRETNKSYNYEYPMTNLMVG